MSGQSNKHRYRLTLLLSVVIVAVALLPSIGMSWVLLQQQFNVNQEQVSRTSQRGLRQAITQLTHRFETLSLNIEMLVRDQALADAIEDILYADDSLAIMHHFKTLHPLIHSSYLVDNNWEVIDTHDGLIDPFEQSLMVKSLQQTLAQNPLAIDEQYIVQFDDAGLLPGNPSNHLGIAVIAPVFNRALALQDIHRPLGYFVNVVDVQQIIEHMVQSTGGELELWQGLSLVAKTYHGDHTAKNDELRVNEQVNVASDLLRNQLTFEVVMFKPGLKSHALLGGMFSALVIGGLGIMLASVLLSLWMGRWINQPFSRLKSVINRFKQGQYYIEAGTDLRFRELEDVKLLMGDLGEKVQQQFTSLSHKNHELATMTDKVQKLNATLEQRVAGQTQALTEALEREEGHNQLLHYLLNLTLTLQDCKSPQQVASKSIQGLAELFPQHAIAIRLLPQGGSQDLLLCHGMDDTEAKELLTQDQIEPAQSIMEVHSVTTTGTQVFDIYMMPGKANTALGLLLFNVQQQEQATRDILMLFVRQAASIIQSLMLNQELENLANTDALTGLGNRKAFNDAFTRVSQRAQRYPDNRFGLFVVDANGLKQVNDCYGHAQGDKLLRQIARFLQENVRQTDSVFRLAGDEFAILLEHGDLQACRLLAQRLNNNVKNQQVKVQAGDNNAQSLPLSFSLGYVSSEEHHETDMFKVADARMYRHKAGFYQNKQTEVSV